MIPRSIKETWQLLARTGVSTWRGLADQAKKDDPELARLLERVGEAFEKVDTYLAARLEK